MLRDLLSSRWFQGGIVFFVLCVGGSLLYSWHVQRTTESEFGKRPQPVVSPLKNKTETNTAPVDFQTERVVNTPEENTDTPMSDETEAETIDETEFADLADAFLADDMATEEAPAEEVAVSPFGFGPYPEVPADYFGVPIWKQNPDKISDFPNGAVENIELIDRVLVKLWQQGDRGIIGGSTHNGKVYPHYDNIIYVEWKDKMLPNGDHYLSVSSMLTGAEEGPTIEDIITGNISSNFTVIDYDDAGFDPYQFLNLEDKGY